MDQETENRLQAVVDRHRELREREKGDTSPQHERRLARDHVLAEIPHAFQRLRAAVEELNDAVSEAGLHLQLGQVGELISLEAAFIVSVWPSGEPESRMHFNVGGDGKVTALLVVGETRTSLTSKDIHEVNKAFFLSQLVTLLEQD